MSLVDTRIDIGNFGGGPVTEFLHHQSNSLPFLALYGFSNQGSFSYSKLPARPITLSVLKLDGSCFDIQIKHLATVGELKQAVEAAFSYMPQKGPGKISWYVSSLPHLMEAENWYRIDGIDAGFVKGYVFNAGGMYGGISA
ncbi:unnamed protein product [Linum tenue]|uniref:SNRNP25 ubiquitin-like domain-containing protein n=1 Tax=Linum tenue TaxID=586396 RepID=A0AAV0MC24_9ROSI|nr:unnamed protein product [Linum tenue]